MLKVSEITQDILQSADLELEAMRKGVLNLSAYAEQIHDEVENRTFKKVKKTTIVVALSRLQTRLSNIPTLQPQIYLDKLSVKSPLVTITYEKTRQSLEQSRSLSVFLSHHDPQFITITQGTDELTIIVSQDQLDTTLEYFDAEPKAVCHNLVGVTVQFTEKYLSQPNVIYTILAALAGKRINIIEIVSTYTELTVIIEQAQLEVAIRTLNRFFRV